MNDPLQGVAGDWSRLDLMTFRPSLATVEEVGATTATVRVLGSSGGGAESYVCPAIGLHALVVGAVVLVVFLSDDPGSGVVVGALTV